MKRTSSLILLVLSVVAVQASLAAQDVPAPTPPGGAAGDEVKRLQGILTRADSPLASRQDAATMLLGRMPEAAEALLAGLANTETPDIPLAVLKAMFDDGRAEPALLPALLKLATVEKLDARLAEALPATLAVYRGKPLLDTLLARIGESPSAAEQVMLVNALGLTGEKDAVPPLIEILKSEQASVRQAAGRALSKITFIDGLGESVEKWSRWWQENGRKPREAWLAFQLEALKTQTRTMKAQFDEQAALITLLTKRLVESAEASLQKMPEAERPARAVQLLDDAVPQLRLLGAGAARELLVKSATPDKALIEKLLARSEDEAPGVRAAVALALGVSKDKRASELLMGRLVKESDLLARAAVIDALGELREAQAVAGLVKVLTGNQEALVVHAAGALGQIGERSSPTAEAAAPAIEPMCQLLTGAGGKSAGADVREAMARALGRIGRKEALEALATAVDDESASVRFYAAKGLGNIPEINDKTIDVLLTHLGDADKGVRGAVAITLGKLGDGKVSQVIAAQLAPTSNEKDAEVRGNLWRSLIAIQKRETDPKVPTALGDQFAVYGDKASLDGAVQLYEIAVEKFGSGSGNGRLHSLRLKLADAYMQSRQAGKAALILQELLKSPKDDTDRAILQRRLAEAQLQMPPYVTGAEALAEIARTEPPGGRDAILKMVFDQVQGLQAADKAAEAYAVLKKFRDALGAKWGESPEAGRMETLTQRIARSVFDKAAVDLSSEDAAVGARAAEEIGRLLDGLPGLSRDLLLGGLQTALEGTDAARIAALEKLLPRVQVDLETYQAARTQKDKLSLVQAWRSGGAGGAAPKEKTE